MRDNVQESNKVLGRVEDGNDRRVIEMKRANSKMNKMLKKGSDCCLWFVIFVELAIGILILLYL